MLAGLAVFLLLLVALLSIPISLTFQVSWRKDFQSNIELQWGFGLVRVQIPSVQPRTPPSLDDEPNRKEGRPKRSTRRKKNVFTIVRQKQVRRRIMRFMGDLWRAVHKKDVSLCARVGLGDPADTGQLWAVFGPVAGMLAGVQEASVKIEPEFFDATLELDSSGTLRFVPLRVVYLTAMLLLSRPIRQGMKQVRIAA